MARLTCPDCQSKRVAITLGGVGALLPLREVRVHLGHQGNQVLWPSTISPTSSVQGTLRQKIVG